MLLRRSWTGRVREGEPLPREGRALTEDLEDFVVDDCFFGLAGEAIFDLFAGEEISIGDGSRHAVELLALEPVSEFAHPDAVQRKEQCEHVVVLEWGNGPCGKAMSYSRCPGSWFVVEHLAGRIEVCTKSL